jgi:urease accessory protein
VTALAPVFAEWPASLSLSFARARSRTQLARARHEGPLRVQRPFYPEGEHGPCHVYVLHPPAGVVSGDRLLLEVELAPDTSALLTTPGATKLYRARAVHDAGDATLEHRFVVAAGSVLEWLPQESIAYDGARARIATHIELAAGASYAGWEVLCLGRPAARERFSAGRLGTLLTLARAGHLCLFERGLYAGGDALLSAAWGLGGLPVLATFVVAAAGAEASWVDTVRAEVAPLAREGLLAATLVRGVVVVRYLGATTREARSLFEAALAVLRPRYAGRAAVHPRIWST